jgi:hypothetical protein
LADVEVQAREARDYELPIPTCIGGLILCAALVSTIVFAFHGEFKFRKSMAVKIVCPLWAIGIFMYIVASVKPRFTFTRRLRRRSRRAFEKQLQASWLR